MPVYRVIRKATGEEVTRYAAAQIIEGEWPLDDYEHVEFVEDAVPPAPTSVKITRLAFRNRFTMAEKAAIEFAAIDNPQAPVEQRQMTAMLRSFMADVQAATFIDLQCHDTRAGVMQLEQVGLIAAGRASVILDTPPTDEEMWHGE